MSSGTDKIVSSIMSEAQGKADIIMQEANAEIATINADAEKTAQSEKNKILENGKKAEYGTFNELMELDGIFKEMYDKQQLEKQLSAE